MGSRKRERKKEGRVNKVKILTSIKKVILLTPSDLRFLDWYNWPE